LAEPLKAVLFKLLSGLKVSLVNDRVVVLYKVCDCCANWKYKMAATVGHSYT